MWIAEWTKKRGQVRAKISHIFKSPYWCNLSRLFVITSVKEQLKYHYSVELLLFLGLMRPSLFMKNIWQLSKYGNIVDIFSWMIWNFERNPFFLCWMVALICYDEKCSGFLAQPVYLSLIHIWRCRRIERCRSRWSPYH